MMKRAKDLKLKDFTERSDGLKPWERHPAEEEIEFRWFEYYMRYNPKKTHTISRVCALWCEEYDNKFCDSIRKRWSYAFNKFYWDFRKRAYWKSLQKTFDGQIVELAENHAKQFEQYVAQLKEQEWEKAQELMALGDALLKKAEQMLEIPIVEEEVVEDEEGFKVIISPTSNFKIGDIPAMARAAAKMVETAKTLGDTAIQHIAQSANINPRNVDEHVDFKELSMDQLEALKLGVNLKDVKDLRFNLEELRQESYRKNQ